MTSHERYPVYRATLDIVAKNGLYDLLVPQLEKVEKWVEEWGSSVEEKRDLFLTIAGIAEEANDDEYGPRKVSMGCWNTRLTVH